MKSQKTVQREQPIPENKVNTVEQLAQKMKSSNTILIASTKGLPTSQYQLISKKLRGKADVIVAKKNLISLAIDKAGKPGFEDLKKEIPANFALMFSDRDAFELSGILVDSLSPTRAKAGDIAPEDIKIEPGPTDLIPGPAISELGAVGLKVSVEAGKLAIKNSAVIVKGGEEINDKVAGVLGKLNITPMKVGFIPVAAYDSKDKKVYKNIKIDKKGTLEELREAIGRSLGFAVSRGYVTDQTISFFIAKAGIEAMALEKKTNTESGKEDSQ